VLGLRCRRESRVGLFVGGWDFEMSHPMGKRERVPLPSFSPPPCLLAAFYSLFCKLRSSIVGFPFYFVMLRKKHFPSPDPILLVNDKRMSHHHGCIVCVFVCGDHKTATTLVYYDSGALLLLYINARLFRNIPFLLDTLHACMRRC
jgi:hypothetical protein